jgi:hypothetical protein
MTLSHHPCQIVNKRAWVAAALMPLIAVSMGCAVTRQGTASPVGRDKEVLSDFTKRVDRYMELHDKLRMQGAPPKPMAFIGENQVSTHLLAARIRVARRAAHRGEIFSPAIAATLRTAIDRHLSGASAARTRASIRDDGPEKFALQVNDAYRDGASLATMPPNLLEVLPRLPEGLEYRIVDTHLILRDVDADIVVDYLVDVMCSGC